MEDNSINDTNPRVKDVEAQFKKITNDAKKRLISGNTDELNIGVDHIQGIARNATNVFLTHSSPGERGILIVCSRGENSKILQKVKLHNKGYPHPGGIQLIGDVLVIPVEKDVGSFVMFYDLRPIALNKEPQRLEVQIERGAKAGAAGITSYFNSLQRQEVHLVGVYDNGSTWIYESNGKPLDSPELSFTRTRLPDLKQSDYSAINLLTDDSNRVWMIGFRTKKKGAAYVEDYMDLYQFDFAQAAFEKKVMNQHVITKHGSTKGSYGVHFRWAGGLIINSSDSIAALACQRNFVGGPQLGSTTYNVIDES